MKHFLQETDFSPLEASRVFAKARDLKRARGKDNARPLAGQTWALLFSKSSTRTRVSFEVGIHELGGNPLFLSKSDLQLGRGESIEDTARVLSRYVHGFVVRTYAHAEVEALARHGSRPVINGLTDSLHPCQVYTDAFTLAERWAGADGDLFASLRGRTVAFLGDTASNMAQSWILGGAFFGMQVRLAGPAGFEPGPEVRARLQAAGLPEDAHQFTTDPMEAVRGADVVYTDVWVSMGKEVESAERLARLAPYQVSAKVFTAARPDAYFQHCLPAYPGKEVAEEVLASPRSIIFDQAENRLHMQKAILCALNESR